MQTQALNLIDTEISKPFKAHDERDMQTVLSFLEQQQEQQQQLHLDRVHSAYYPTFPILHLNQALQALAAVADRLNTFDDLPSYPALNLIIPQIKLSYSRVISSYERRIKTFLDTPIPPDVGLRIYNQIISQLTHISNLLDHLWASLTATPFANTQQTECRILYPPPHSITDLTSIANIGDFDDTFSTTHNPGSDASYYSITSPTKTSPQPSSISPRKND
jgi:hypothetical protein